jgi:uncharacterized oligopeptide transporter (OPT) family protein
MSIFSHQLLDNVIFFAVIFNVLMIELNHDLLHQVNLLIKSSILGLLLSTVFLQSLVHMTILEQLNLHLLPVKLVVLKIPNL